MTLINLIKRAFCSLLETANLVSLTIVGAVSFLTADYKLLRIVLAVEGAYIIVIVLMTAEWLTSVSFMPAKLGALLRRYRQRLDIWLERYRKTNNTKNQDNFLLDQVLLVVSVAGFVVIAFFGFGKHLLTYRWSNLTHAEEWEAGAIAWTGLFLIYYLFKTSPTRNVTVNKIIMLGLGGFNAWFWWKAWHSIGGTPLQHIGWIMGIAACFLFIDLMISIFHDDDLEKARSRASLFWADGPMVFSLIVLFVYLKRHADTEAPEVFVAGVVACQLLISNAVFVVMEFGLLQPPVPGLAIDKSGNTELNTQAATTPTGQHP